MIGTWEVSLQITSFLTSLQKQKTLYIIQSSSR